MIMISKPTTTTAATTTAAATTTTTTTTITSACRLPLLLLLGLLVGFLNTAYYLIVRITTCIYISVPFD